MFLKRLRNAIRRPYELFGPKRVREEFRVWRLPRHTKFATDLLGFTVTAADNFSFMSMSREIFRRQIYCFKTDATAPRILDLGANIGLSVFYFKQLYPKARITAFEPDPAIFDILKQNILQAGYSDVELVNKAVWNVETTLPFRRDGSDAGRLGRGQSELPVVQVPTTRLGAYLGVKVDLLKMDIEGAEVDVIADCATNLRSVERLFVEFHSFKGRPQRLGELASVLETAGFRLWVENLASCPSPFISHEEYMDMDMQLNVHGAR